MNSHQLRIAIFTFLCASATLVAQKAEPTITRNPTLTPQHQNIPGTRLAWVPPQGFQVKPGGMDVFVDSATNGALILMWTDSPFPVETLLQSMGLNTDSTKMSISKFRLNDFKGFLMESIDTTDHTGYGRFIVCLEDKIGTTTFMVSLPYAAPAEKAAALKEALLTFVLQKGIK